MSDYSTNPAFIQQQPPDDNTKQNILRSISEPTHTPSYNYNTHDNNANIPSSSAPIQPHEQYRYSAEYYNYYYSQKPLDRRLPVPLIDNTTYTHATRLIQAITQSPLLSAQAAYPPLHAFDTAGISTDSELLHAATNTAQQHPYTVPDDSSVHSGATSHTHSHAPSQYNAFGGSLLLHLPQHTPSQSPLIQSSYYHAPTQYNTYQQATTTSSDLDNFDLSKRFSLVSITDGGTDSFSDYSQHTNPYYNTQQQQNQPSQYNQYNQRDNNKPPLMYGSQYDTVVNARQQYLLQPQYSYQSTAPQLPQNQQYSTLNQYNTQYHNQSRRGNVIRGSTRGRGISIRGGGNTPRIDRTSYRNLIDISSYTPGSAAVESFRQNTDANNIPLQQCINDGILLELCIDQFGSRYVQQRLEQHDPHEIEQCFTIITPESLRLCSDVFGNYVIQKMFEIGTSEQRQSLLHVLSGSLVDLSTHMYGCRVIQRAIEVSDSTIQSLIVSELSEHVLQCIRDANGNHVIGKALQCISTPLNNSLIESFRGHTVELCCHAYGCRVVQRLLEHSTLEQHQFVLDEILTQINILSQNQYGNYVVQHILEHGTPQNKTAIIQGLAGHYVDLARHKFASNVIEKALQNGTTQDKQIILNELINDTDSGSSSIIDPYSDDITNPLILLVRDQFGNFVIQKIFDCLDTQQCDTLIQSIKQHINVLRKLPYSKHILSKIDKLSRSNDVNKPYISPSISSQQNLINIPAQPQQSYASTNTSNTTTFSQSQPSNPTNHTTFTSTTIKQPMSFAAIAAQSRASGSTA